MESYKIHIYMPDMIVRPTEHDARKPHFASKSYLMCQVVVVMLVQVLIINVLQRTIINQKYLLV